MIFDRLGAGARWALRRPVLAFALYAVWLCAERFVLGPSSYLEMHDIGDSMIPRNMAVIRELLEYGPSYWLVSVLGGVDRLAQTHSYIAPSALFHLAFPSWAAFPLTLMASLFLSSYFTFRVCLDELRLPPIACLVAGAANVWVYNNEMLISQWGYAAFPFMIWALGRIDAAPRHQMRRTVLLGLGFSWASVFATSTPFCLLGLAVWFSSVQPKASMAFWRRFGVLCAASLLLQLQPVWALLANLVGSQRAAAELGLPSSWRDLPGVVLGALHGLLSLHVPVVLAAGGLAASRFRDRGLNTTWLCLLAFTIGGALLSFTAALLPDALSALRAYNFTRFNQLAPLFAAVAGARGLSALIARYPGAKERLPALALLALLSISLAGKARGWRDWAFGGSFASNFESRTLREAIPSEPKGTFRVVTILHGFYPLYASAYGLESVDGEANIYPRRYNRFWAKVIEPSAGLRPMLASQHRSFMDIGTRVQLSLDTIEHEPEGLQLERYYRMSLLSLLNVRYLISRHPLLGGGLRPIVTQQPWANLSKRERWMLRLRENFLGKSYFYVYENPSWLPRYFVAGRVRVFSDEESLLKELAAASPAELRETAFLSAANAPAPAPARTRRSGAVALAHYEPDRIALELGGEASGVLVVTNSYSPYWTCEVDGVRREIFPVDGAFWGVMVDSSDKKVVFTYEPPYSARVILARR